MAIHTHSFSLALPGPSSSLTKALQEFALPLCPSRRHKGRQSLLSVTSPMVLSRLLLHQGKVCHCLLWLWGDLSCACSSLTHPHRTLTWSPRKAAFLSPLEAGRGGTDRPPFPLPLFSDPDSLTGSAGRCRHFSDGITTWEMLLAGWCRCFFKPLHSKPSFPQEEFSLLRFLSYLPLQCPKSGFHGLECLLPQPRRQLCISPSKILGEDEFQSHRYMSIRVQIQASSRSHSECCHPTGSFHSCPTKQPAHWLLARLTLRSVHI